MTAQQAHPDLPNDLKAKLLEFAKRIPGEDRKRNFLRNVTSRLGELACQFEDTLIFSAAGWVVGQLVDNLLTVEIPLTELAVALTGDEASTVGALGGAAIGLYRDFGKANERKRIATIVGEELRRALSGAC